MARELSAWASKILEVLDDDEWHTRDEVIYRAMPLVPPGRGYKRGETDRLGQVRRRKERGVEVKDGSRLRGDPIASGQRMIVSDSLVGLERTGRIIKNGDKFHINRDYVPNSNTSH